jgi:hypothetical protein
MKVLLVVAAIVLFVINFKRGVARRTSSRGLRQLNVLVQTLRYRFRDPHDTWLEHVEDHEMARHGML